MKKKINFCFLILALSLLFWGCGPDSSDVEVTVTITPATANVAHGGGQTFTAVVNGEDNQSVTWAVEGKNASGTTITANGRLTVATAETATSLTVRATSVSNTSKSGTAAVTVTGGSATVTSVTVSPTDARVNKNGKRHFIATVAGTGNPGQNVTWTVAGGVSGTDISPDGWLTVAAAETATTLTVKATSTVDTNKSGNVTVTVGTIVFPPIGSNGVLDPATTNTQLTNNSFSPVTGHGGGNKSLPGSIYGYETWDEAGSTGTASFRWYGANNGGGAAFTATWNNPKDYLARVGYFWGSNGGNYASYENIYCGFNHVKTPTGRYNGNFSYIGIYGWSITPLIEYYIVEDWYGNNWNDPTTPVSGDTILSDIATGQRPQHILGTFYVDDSDYIVYRKTRTGDSIDGYKTFNQFFSVRQTPRQHGTISITEHFKKWEEYGMELGNLYECKFLVEVGGIPESTLPNGPGTGSFDARLIQFYRAKDDGTILQITP